MHSQRRGKAWLQEQGLVDLWREAHPHSTQFSFYSHAHRTYARLDHLLGTSDVHHLLSDVQIVPAAVSDHDAVTLTMGLPGLSRPPGRWRFRESMLHHPQTRDHISAHIKEYLRINDTADVKIASLWGALKAVTRGELIAKSTFENKERQKHRDQLNVQVREPEQAYRRTGVPRLWRQLKNVRAALAGLDWDRAEYAILRLKHAYYSGGDKAGRMLAHKLRGQTLKTKVQSLHTNEGERVERDEEIAEAFRKFYVQLYSDEQLDQRGTDLYLQNTGVTALTAAASHLGGGSHRCHIPVKTSDISGPRWVFERVLQSLLPFIGPDPYPAL